MQSSCNFSASFRSQSSMQLYGTIEHYQGEQSSEETSDESELRIRGYETLIHASTSVLSCIQMLRRIICQYAYGRMGRELQHLSLTVASFERVLYTFIRDEIVLASQAFANDKTNALSIDAFRDKSALKDIIPLVPCEERFTILSGGMGSLLRHATKSLDETKEVLESLHSSYDPDWEARWSKRSIFVFLSIYFGFKRLFSKRQSIVKRMLLRMFPAKRDLFKYAIGALIIADYWNRYVYYQSDLRRIKIQHARVLMTLRLFLLCQHVLQRSRMVHGCASHQRLLIDAPMECDIDDDLKHATALLVERVPLPSEYYDQSCEPLGLTLFKIGSNTLLASSAFAHYLLRHKKYKHPNKRMRYFGPLLVWLAIPYYAIRARKAARYASRILIDHPDVDVIRLGWNIYGESRLVQLMTKLRSQKVAVHECRFISLNISNDVAYWSPNKDADSDIRVFIFSTRPMASVASGSWDGAVARLTPEMEAIGLPRKRPVLLYIHGGGFFGRFLQSDILNICAWANQLGVVIVYVDYGLAPETQYPVPLKQTHRVYEWIQHGGLGFSPDEIVLFGESAGGNLAAACCIHCIQEKKPLPTGVVLLYPALNLHVSPSPSRFLHQSDPLLPRGVLELALNSYYPSHGNSRQYKHNIHDPLVSPGLAENAILRKFPPTTLVVGDLDPLLDDSVDMYTRLKILQVPSTLKIYQGLSHGYIIYGSLVPEAQRAIDETCERIRNSFVLKKMCPQNSVTELETLLESERRQSVCE